jgi:hypothetical protein
MKLRMLVALAVLLTATAAYADGIAKATIPFSFQAGGQVFPAGRYLITYSSQWPGVALQQLGGKALAWVPVSAPREAVGETGKLVFNVYGDNYFLRQISIPGVVGADLFRSKAESRQQIASKKPAKGEVAALARN